MKANWHLTEVIEKWAAEKAITNGQSILELIFRKYMLSMTHGTNSQVTK